MFLNHLHAALCPSKKQFYQTVSCGHFPKAFEVADTKNLKLPLYLQNISFFLLFEFCPLRNSNHGGILEVSFFFLSLSLCICVCILLFVCHYC